MVEQLEKNATSFLQEEHGSDIPIGQEGTTSICNVDVPINFPNDIEEFKALIGEMKNQSLMITQRLEGRMATQTKAMADQVKTLDEQTKAMVEQTKTVIEEHAKKTAM